MPNFEQIVRPFSPTDITPPKQGVDSIPAVVPDVILIVGGTGQGKIINGSNNHTTTVYVIKHPKEETS